MTLARHEYVLDLSQGTASVVPGALVTRCPTPEDGEALAVLMLDAYLGTIDYEGEALDDARDEVARYFGGSPMLGCSFLVLADDRPVSASLVSVWAARGCPIVSYVMTAAAFKNRGLASAALARSLAALEAAGQREVRAAISEGNVPSETIFARAGFSRV